MPIHFSFYSKLLFCLPFLLCSCLAFSQYDPGEVVTITTQNKLFYSGKFVKITKDSIFIDNEDIGNIGFDRANIKKIKKGKVKFFGKKHSMGNQPFYISTAIPSGSGNHYYRNYSIFGNDFNFGVSENLNLSIGFETASLFAGGNSIPVIQGGFKAGRKVDSNVHMGVAAKVLVNDEFSALFASIPLTFGDINNSFTVGPAVGTTEDGSGFALMMQGNARISDGFSLFVDAVTVQDEFIGFAGMNFIFSRNVALILGAAFVTDGGVAPGIAFTFPFGNWNK